MEIVQKFLGIFVKKLLQKRNLFCIMVVQSGVKIHLKDIKWGKLSDFHRIFRKGVTNDERSYGNACFRKCNVFVHL